ncbi:hypothetical protein AB0D46_32250 [Streptomyces sp. NPDC048383]
MRPNPVEPNANDVPALTEPSTELLDRAPAGWERFLDTFEGVPDE